MALNVANVDVQLTDSAATVLSVPANTQYTVLKATACNTDVSPRALTFYRIPDGGTAGPTNLILDAIAIGAGATIILPISGQTLFSGQAFQAFADVTATVNISLSYAYTP